MSQVCLLPEDIVRTDGVGPEIEVRRESGRLMVLTLSINRTTEQAGLAVSVWGSADGINWGPKPLASFPQKFYCGLYSTLLNLSARPDVRFVRVQWKVNRLTKFSGVPLVGFSLSAEESGARVQHMEPVFAHAAVA